MGRRPPAPADTGPIPSPRCTPTQRPRGRRGVGLRKPSGEAQAELDGMVISPVGKEDLSGRERGCTVHPILRHLRLDHGTEPRDPMKAAHR